MWFVNPAWVLVVLEKYVQKVVKIGYVQEDIQLRVLVLFVPQEEVCSRWVLDGDRPKYPLVVWQLIDAYAYQNTHAYGD